MKKTELGNLTSSSSTGSHKETKMGPSYINLLLGNIENIFFPYYHRPNPHLYKRYVDDCLIQQRITQSIYCLSQFFSPNSKTHFGTFRKFLSFP